MKEYCGYDTGKNGQLVDDLRRTRNANTLYLSHYYFALNDGRDLIFYYNPQYYWDKIAIEKVEDYVWDNLSSECAVFKNFDPDRRSKSNALDNKSSYPAFSFETPRIGNHYSCLGSRIVSHHRRFYFLGDFGECWKLKAKEITDYDVVSLLHWAVVTKTPNFIRSIFDLKCFKRGMGEN